MVIITSPGRASPLFFISAILYAVARATIAPSASDTSPIKLGLAPIPPSLPITPSVGQNPQ